MNEKLKSLASKIVILILGVLAIGSVAVAFSGSSQVEIETCDGCLFGASQSEELGASGTRFPNGISADTTSPSTGEVRGTTLEITSDAVITGGLNFRENGSAITATTTLTASDSGETYFISGGQKTITLPATSTLSAGTLFRFYVGGSITATTTINTDSGANEIEGALIVAGAVVDCDAEDTIRFVEDGENIGDFVELRWSGTYWMIGPSGALTSAKMTCTAS